MKSDQNLENSLTHYASLGYIVLRTENNPYLKVSYRGAGGLISEKWNVKIYTSGSVVCNDFVILRDLSSGNIKEPDKSLVLLEIDDAGGGFPLAGVMVGVSDGKRVETDTVDVSYFQGDLYNKRLYLSQYADKGLRIVEGGFGASPSTHRINICTGFINNRLKMLLREKGYDVRVVEIKGMLQDQLEDLFRSYVKEVVGSDVAYDPKVIASKKELADRYYRLVRWARHNCPHLMKTGWKSLQSL